MDKKPHFIRRFGVLVMLVFGLFYFGLSENESSAANVPCCQDCPTYQGCLDTCGSSPNCPTFCSNSVRLCNNVCVVC